MASGSNMDLNAMDGDEYNEPATGTTGDSTDQTDAHGRRYQEVDTPDDDQHDPTASSSNVIDDTTRDALMAMDTPPMAPPFVNILGPYDRTYYRTPQLFILFFKPPICLYSPEYHALHYPIPSHQHCPHDELAAGNRRGCKHWQKGHCRNGSMCDCYHDPKYFPQAVCRTFLRGQQCRQDCHHVHGHGPSDEPGLFWTVHPEDHSYPHLPANATTILAHTEPPTKHPRDLWLRLNPATNHVIYPENVQCTVWPERSDLLQSAIYQWTQDNRYRPANAVDTRALANLIADNEQHELEYTDEIHLWRQRVNLWRRLHNVPPPPQTTSNSPGPANYMSAPSPGFPGRTIPIMRNTGTSRPTTTTAENTTTAPPAPAPQPSPAQQPTPSPEVTPSPIPDEPEVELPLVVIDQSFPTAKLTAAVQANLQTPNITVQLPKATPGFRIPDLTMPDPKAKAHNLPVHHPMAVQPANPPQHQALSNYLTAISTPQNDPYWADDHQLMDSVLDHLYAWLAHVREQSNTGTEYLQEALSIVHANFLSTLGPAPLQLHTDYLEDIRRCLHTMIYNLQSGMSYFLACNTGPRHGLTNRAPPTWLVDPSLLIQIAHACCRHTPNAVYHRLPHDITMRQLQLHFRLRHPYVPGQPAVKAPPPIHIFKAPEPANPLPIAKAHPNLAPNVATVPKPTMPWPSQYPIPVPGPAPHPPPPQPQPPIVKRTTTTTHTQVTTVTTRYYVEDTETGEDV